MKDLHSTMVLFKLITRNPSLKPIIFTFHYGPIQMNHSLQQLRSNAIYIPLWSYSNIRLLKYHILKNQFTFHYGPIQIISSIRIISSEDKFTFHYGPIQIDKT